MGNGSGNRGSDGAWERMLGRPEGAVGGGAAGAPAGSGPGDPPAEAGKPMPLAAAAKWGAIAVLGVVAIGAVVWVIATNRTRPAIVPTPAGAVVQNEGQATGTAPAAVNSGSVLDLNNATAAQLERLPGIGPALAARIVADRQKHGPFTSLQHLDRVEGIGPKTIEKLRPYLSVK